VEDAKPIKQWINRAFALLNASLENPKHELNELDWKAEISSDKKRVAEHLSAFSNYPKGGFLVFGIDATGMAHGVDQKGVENILNQIANIGRSSVEPPIAIDYAVEGYNSIRLLFIYISESAVKPVHIRGKGIEHAFIRSGGTTRPASRQDIGMLMLNSRTPRWEELHATVLLSEAELFAKLNTDPILKMVERPSPTTNEERLSWLESEKFVFKNPAGGGYITNLGAIAAARRITEFEDISRKAVRVIVYDGLNKSKAKLEREGTMGYAISFQGIMEFVMSLLPQSEVIEQALRTKRTVYPEIALRELIANSLIHEDYTISGAGPLIEIFDDRIEISNPGGLLPSKQLDRLIGTQPESRNEQLARAFRRYKICEERGSGLLKGPIYLFTLAP
jgi:ATP-dependent DNA helicase RecG